MLALGIRSIPNTDLSQKFQFWALPGGNPNARSRVHVLRCFGTPGLGNPEARAMFWYSVVQVCFISAVKTRYYRYIGMVVYRYIGPSPRRRNQPEISNLLALGIRSIPNTDLSQKLQFWAFPGGDPNARSRVRVLRCFGTPKLGNPEARTMFRYSVVQVCFIFAVKTVYSGIHVCRRVSLLR